MSHTFMAHSALGEQLQFRRMSGREEMGRLFKFEVDMLSESDAIDPKSLLGTDLTVEVDLTTEAAGGGKRYLSGQVTAFRFAGRDGDFFSYRATLSPWLWLATRRSDFKIFQNKKVPDIVQEVLAPYGFGISNKLTNSYRTWEYMVQYGETDFNFISRLLEHEGAYYYFEHQMGSHKLVLADDMGSHSPLPNGPSTIPYYPGSRAAHVHDEDFIDGWNAAQDIASGKFAADDYDFTKPKALLDTRQAQPAGHSQDSWEIFHWPGGYTDMGDGQQYARVRIEQQKAERETIHGVGNARNLAPGYLFNLSKYPRADQNQRYLITAADYHFTENVQRTDGGGGSGRAKRAGEDSPTTYRLGIDAVPSTVSWRSQCITEKPRTTGPQTAEVTGPAGEEIYTDKYGRVKVHFHWDRHGPQDENSSCWIRVSQNWAGAGYGSMHIPRIGQEVIVDFLNGDPDYPIITGRVYNNMQMPAWKLPDNKTQSGTQTRWSKGGGGKNMLRFEDKKGIEHLELSSDYGQTQLNMGYLLNQSNLFQRSYGFELRTTEWGTVRADKGLLLTTYMSDLKDKISRDNPDGYEHLGNGLQGVQELMAQAKSAVDTMNQAIEAINSLKMGHMTELSAAIESMVGQKAAVASLGQMASALASFVSGGSQGGGPEQQMPTDTDPAMPSAQNIQELSRDIKKPIVSIVSPEGQSLISPKPIVVSSGQTVSVYGTSHTTISSKGQLTNLAQTGMLTHVTEGGQRNTVQSGDIASHAQTGNMNLTAQQNLTLTSATRDASLLANQVLNLRAQEDSVLVKAGQHIRLEAGQSITLVVGPEGAPAAYLKLTAEGDVVLYGKNNGVIQLGEKLDQFGKPINLNCG